MHGMGCAGGMGTDLLGCSRARSTVCTADTAGGRGERMGASAGRWLLRGKACAGVRCRLGVLRAPGCCAGDAQSLLRIHPHRPSTPRAPSHHHKHTHARHCLCALFSLCSLTHARPLSCRCGEKPECPLCRAPVALQQLVALYHTNC